MKVRTNIRIKKQIVIINTDVIKRRVASCVWNKPRDAQIEVRVVSQGVVLTVPDYVIHAGAVVPMHNCLILNIGNPKLIRITALLF